MAGKKVLIVDDEKELLKALHIRLTSWGYDVLTAGSGEEAISLVEKEAPDVLILDIMMPVMNGIETLKRIRSFNQKIPVLMMTAYSKEAIIKDLDELGISGFISKGSDFGCTSEIIKTILKGAKSK